MGSRLVLGVCAVVLSAGATACGGGGTAPSGTNSVGEAAVSSQSQDCTRTVTAADKLWVDSGQVTDDTESQERNERGRDFAASYLGAPEMQIFLKAGSDGVNAINAGATVTEGIAAASRRARVDCATAYPD
ncbi:hypothetical protein [Streptomyces sp. NBC_00568]|uniref:hypothetical protein n=1 Tax=Streptomyces sp. NBC_00568 TaxID=2975779 RepID=UPI00224D4607|nr:hypothetical protein [Streptomyces sp. NBC_00568]MCX4993561.1 hypothetical protein [Streptomyces sp. NBC_00568]